MKNLFSFIIFCLILGYFSLKYCGTSDSPKTVTQETPKIITLTETEIIRVIKRVDSVLTSNDKEVRKFEAQYRKFVNLYSVGAINVFQVYEVADIAKGSCESASRRINSFDFGIDDRMPNETRTKLNDILTDASLAFSTKEKSYEVAMEYFNDSPKPSTIKEFKKQNNLGIELIESCGLKMATLKLQYNMLGKIKKKTHNHATDSSISADSWDDKKNAAAGNSGL